MTSSPETKKSRRRRSTLDRRLVRRMLVIAGGVGAFAIALYAFLTLSPLRLDPASARASIERSAVLLKSGNPTAAREAALAAIRSDPKSPLAHLTLARAQLVLGDGMGAEAEIRRAVDAGWDGAQVHQLTAEALVLEGKPDRAIDEVEKTDAADRRYGLRIRARALTALGNFAGASASLDEAMRIAPNDAAVWTDVARFRLAVDNIAGAADAAVRALALDKDNIDALVVRGKLVRNQFGLVAALPWFEAALKHDPAYYDALIEYAATLGDAGRTNDMLAATRRALAARPGAAPALYLQAVLAARARNYPLARSLVQKTGGTIDDMPGMLLLSGTLDIDLGANEQAIGKLRRLVDAQPTNFAARRLLAVALLRTGAAQAAIDALRPVTDRGDADSYALTLAARGFERLGDRATAARLLDRAAAPGGGSAPFAAGDSVAVLSAPAAQNPGDPGSVAPLIRAMLASGDGAGALARAQQLAGISPGAPESHLILGDIFAMLGRPADAAAAYKAAANLRFDEATMLRLVEAQDAAGQRGDAANTLALFLSQNPADVAALRLTAGWQMAGGNFDAAIETLEALRARIGDRDAAIDAELSTAYAATGNDQAARDYGEAAYGLAPANPAAADAFGWALYQTGDNAGALELLQKAVSLAPNHAGVRWHLAQLLADIGRKPEARAQAQAALADPRFTDRDAANALIATLG